MKQLINPAGTEAVYEDWEMSQAVRVGDTLWVSGKTGTDEDEQLVPGLERQTRQAFQNIDRILRAVDSGLQDVVELVSYHTSMQELDVFRKVKSEFLPQDFPAWTAVGVSALYHPEALIEIKVTAVVGCGNDESKVGK